MVYCDNNERILEWGSEEMYVWYRSPIDNRPHRYFPDFYIKVKESTGAIKKYIIEIKPNKQTSHQQNQKDRQRVIYVKHMNTQRIKQSGTLLMNGVKIVDMSSKYLQRKS